jgi:hypothetical protein
MTMPIHPPVVYVEWTDTASVAHLWTDREEALKTAATLMTPIAAAGLLLADEERGIILTLLYSGHNDDVGHVVVIPRSAITLMRVVLKGRGFKRDDEAPA